MVPLILAAFVSLCLSVVTCPGAGEGLKPGDPLPELKAADFEGQLPDIAGKVVLLDFWASWCGPCKKSFPELEKIHAKYKERGLVVLGVNEDEAPAEMKKFLEKVAVSFPIVRDLKHKLITLAAVRAMPTSFLVDRSGRIVSVHAKFEVDKTVPELEKAIEALIAPETGIKPADAEAGAP